MAQQPKDNQEWWGGSPLDLLLPVFIGLLIGLIMALTIEPYPGTSIAQRRTALIIFTPFSTALFYILWKISPKGFIGLCLSTLFIVAALGTIYQFNLWQVIEPFGVYIGFWKYYLFPTLLLHVLILAAICIILSSRRARRSRIRVRLQNGQTGTVEPEDFDPATMEKL